MTISSPGVGSGLDINSIITQLVAVEKQPLQGMQKASDTIKTKISTYGKISSLIDSLQSAANNLSASSLWLQTQSSSSDTGSVEVTTSGTASNASYSVQVNSIARSQTLVSTSMDPSLNLTGSLAIEIGQWQNANSTGAFTSASPPRVLAVNLGSATTLESVRDAINAQAAPIRASIIADVSGKRLVVSSSETGVGSAFRITTSPASGQASYDLQKLSYPPLSAGGGQSVGLTVANSAQNADLSINGIALNSSGNNLDTVLDGMKLKLNKASANPVQISVASDAAAQRKAINDLIAAYNAVVAEISTDTAYDPSTKVGGPLQSDSAAIGVGRQLRNLLSQSNNNWGTLNSLNAIGLQFDRDGKLSIKTASKLDDALKSPDKLAILFANAPANGSNKGLAVMLKDLTNTMLGAQGTIGTKTASLQTQLKSNQDNQDKVNARAALVETRLKQQYSALDAQLAQSQALSNYVNQQFGPKKSN